MTKFIYLADSHCGANPVGYHQQRAYPESLPEVIAALEAFLAQDREVSFILHGGDLVDFTTEENISEAADLFSLSVPVYLCLGNHDLTTREALFLWLRQAPQLFPGGKAEYTLELPDCHIHVVPNHWGTPAYHWDVDQEMRFASDQLDFLEKALSRSPEVPHILLTHGPVFGLPGEQTGFSGPYHSPNQEFTHIITAMAARHRHLRCVLGAHTHMNMRVFHEGAQFVTTSAIVETPFECKLFEVAQGTVSMTTITLGSQMKEGGEYDFNKTFVQGRARDRTFP